MRGKEGERFTWCDYKFSHKEEKVFSKKTKITNLYLDPPCSEIFLKLIQLKNYTASVIWAYYEAVMYFTLR